MFAKVKGRLLVALVFIVGVKPLGAQIVTAENYLEQVSERYATFRDYEARITVKSGASAEMEGIVSHLSPSFMRIDFAKPANQAIVFDGSTLTVYIPELQAILTQDVSSSRAGSIAQATPQGLLLMRRNYLAAFVTGPSAVPLESGSREEVIQLKLEKRWGSEGFKTIVLSIDDATKMIRRVSAKTITNVDLQFDFTGAKVNQGIPPQRFLYDSPASANVYNNFLYRDSE
jgi:outer membrane lipoprotein-sorting protein